ncbi:MAG: tetratricopeptide repeat protein [Treponema sp.]|nr:tetratricopeptide repeat protein [Treponema sp.]
MKNVFLRIFCAAFTVVFIVSCSSAPKNPGDINILRIQAEQGIKSANTEAAKGNFEIAFSLLTGFKQNSILVDDSSLIIRVTLALGNVLFSMGRMNEAFAEWDEAVREAERFGNSELLSVARIFKARGNLISKRAEARDVLDEVTRESANVRNNRLYTAFSWQVRGMALSSLGSYTEAEAAIRRSLDIHLNERTLENASYDWYTIASIRSLAGNTAGSIEALETSIGLDRRIENSWGLASSYRAMGDVCRKAGREQDALEAYRRARSIFAAMNNEGEVSQIDRRIRSSN